MATDTQEVKGRILEGGTELSESGSNLGEVKKSPWSWLKEKAEKAFSIDPTDKKDQPQRLVSNPFDPFK